MKDLCPNSARLESALLSPDPFGAAFELAIKLRDSGISQPELLAIFDQSRDLHQHDGDERKYDAVLDVMDSIIGYCRPEQKLYPSPPKQF